MKVIMFDGVEASGKSTLLKKIGEKYDIPVLHFPSDELIEAHKDNMVSKEDAKTRIFIKALLKEELDTIKAHSDNDTILLDRGAISTLAYQGNTNILKYWILEQYKALFKALNINTDNSIAYCFTTPIPGVKRAKKSKAKAMFDKGKEERVVRMKDILNNNLLKDLFGKVYEVEYMEEGWEGQIAGIEEAISSYLDN